MRKLVTCRRVVVVLVVVVVVVKEDMTYVGVTGEDISIRILWKRVIRCGDPER